MKQAGQVLIAVAFLIGAFVSVLDVVLVPWTYFGLALALGACGVILVNVGERRMARQVRESGAGIGEVERALANVVRSIDGIDIDREDLNPYDVHTWIDAEIPLYVTSFVEARETLAHVYGLQAYADVMSHFAAAERYLNRTWSASADGYIDEVRMYLPRARDEFHEAQRMLEGLRPHGDPAS